MLRNSTILCSKRVRKIKSRGKPNLYRIHGALKNTKFQQHAQGHKLTFG